MSVVGEPGHYSGTEGASPRKTARTNLSGKRTTMGRNSGERESHQRGRLRVTELELSGKRTEKVMCDLSLSFFSCPKHDIPKCRMKHS